MEPLRADDVRLVVGGDGTIELGTISGFLRAGFPLALLYLDGELDPRTSAENETDILGSMDIAHPIDVPGAAGALRGIGLRRPSLSADHLVDLGYERNMDGPVEADLFAWRGFADFSVAHVPQHDAEPTLAEAVGCLHSSASIRRAGSTGKEFNLDNADGEGCLRGPANAQPGNHPDGLRRGTHPRTGALPSLGDHEVFPFAPLPLTGRNRPGTLGSRSGSVREPTAKESTPLTD